VVRGSWVEWFGAIGVLGMLIWMPTVEVETFEFEEDTSRK